MKTQIPVFLAVALFVTVSGLLVSSTVKAVDGPAAAAPPAATFAMPRLVDLGATRCIPCRLMAPIIEDLKKEYQGRMQVEFIDVWKNADAEKKYAIKLIPTQIFYDAAGKELFRHEGFFSKEDILAKWKQLGIEFRERKGPL
ncbi:MAG: thioredoxin family protein [Verrucomicrobiota bacterium]